MPDRDFSIRQLQRNKEWLSTHLLQYGTYIKGVIPCDAGNQSIIKLDLSINNPDIAGAREQSEVLSYIRKKLSSSTSLAAVSGFAEERKQFPSGRNMIHLGLDLLSIEDFPVLAPMNGRLYALRSEQKNGDLKIVIQHRLGAFRFYSVFSHISGTTRTLHKPGSLIMAGELLGYTTSNFGCDAGLCLIHFSVFLEAGCEPFEIPENVDISQSESVLCMAVDPTPLLLNGGAPAEDSCRVEPLRSDTACRRSYRSAQAQTICRVVPYMKRFY